MAQMEKDWRTDYNWMDPNDLPVTDDDLNEPIRYFVQDFHKHLETKQDQKLLKG